MTHPSAKLRATLTLLPFSIAALSAASSDEGGADPGGSAAGGFVHLQGAGASFPNPDRRCIDLLAFRQPTAGDLRFVVSVARIAPKLERVADHACKIARAALDLNEPPQLNSYPDLTRIAEAAVIKHFRGW